jgi:cilia- and flagella-associated protein 57
MEVDADIEIATMKVKQEDKLKLEEEMGVDLMAQHALLRKNLHILQKDVDTQRDEIKKLKDKETRLTDAMKSLEKDIIGHKKEIREREETMSEKEKRIFDLKKKNQELEKFRFVLDYKIKELKLQIAPRESEISTMLKQGEEMNLELEQYHKSNLALNLMIDELKLKLEGLRRELLDQKDRSAMNDRVNDKIRRDLQEIWGVRDVPVQLKDSFLKLYRVYVQETVDAEGGKKVGTGGEDPQVAYNRDREMLERSLEGLRRAVKTDAMSNKREVTKMLRERSLLTKELNVLRRDAGDLRLQNKTIERAGLIGPKMDVNLLAETLSLLGISLSKREASLSSACTVKVNSCSTLFSILYYTILYYTILYYTILYYVIVASYLYSVSLPAMNPLPSSLYVTSSHEPSTLLSLCHFQP